MMVEFGAPLDDQEQERHAIRAAIEMQEEGKRLSDYYVQQGRGPIQIGIGIHTGPAVVGNIGSNVRMEYTAIGDTVNVAAGLENATKELLHPILVSEATFISVKDQFNFTYIKEITLKGREEKIKVYSLNLEKP